MKTATVEVRFPNCRAQTMTGRPVEHENLPGLYFVLHRSFAFGGEDCWSVTETTTGYSAAFGLTRREALELFDRRARQYGLTGFQRLISKCLIDKEE